MTAHRDLPLACPVRGGTPIHVPVDDPTVRYVAAAVGGPFPVLAWHCPQHAGGCGTRHVAARPVTEQTLALIGQVPAVELETPESLYRYLGADTAEGLDDDLELGDDGDLTLWGLDTDRADCPSPVEIWLHQLTPRYRNRKIEHWEREQA